MCLTHTHTHTHTHTTVKSTLFRLDCVCFPLYCVLFSKCFWISNILSCFTCFSMLQASSLQYSKSFNLISERPKPSFCCGHYLFLMAKMRGRGTKEPSTWRYQHGFTLTFCVLYECSTTAHGFLHPCSTQEQRDGKSIGGAVTAGSWPANDLRLTCTARVKKTPASEASFFTLKSIVLLSASLRCHTPEYLSPAATSDGTRQKSCDHHEQGLFTSNMYR